MKLTRLITAGLLGAITTAALIVAMFKLIDRDWAEPEDVERRKIADFNMPDREIETQYDQEKPDKPEKPQEQPDIPPPDFDAPDVSPEAISVATPEVTTDVSGINVASFSSD